MNISGKIKEIWLTTLVKISEGNIYIYYNRIEKGEKKVVLIEHRGYLVFTVKCLKGLLKQGP